MEVLNLPAVLFSLLLLFSSIPAPAQSGFSGDSALAVLRVLSVDIGPRPMGSPAERRAMDYAVNKFREFGCQEAYIMPMMVAEVVNTNSGIAVGVLKGRTDRIIIIGGHIDSAGPEIPGANDDGSGVACVIELARILSKQQHESTIMFCCWGGEESGLQGSKYFVDHFGKIDSVVLMLQIDMADGSSVLEIDPEYGEINAPRWLVGAAYETFYDELQSSGLVYPVASATLNAATGGSTGSDHDAFLEKGIPAIDFTSDVDFPIHTPQDHLENFQPSGLKRSGDLVMKLFERFDSAVPSRATEEYMLIQLFTMPLFLSYWVLWMVIGFAFVLAVLSIVVLRNRRNLVEATSPGVRWSTIKLILFALIIQTFIWLSETVIGLIRGYRFPWVNNFEGFVVLGILAGLVGLWLVLRLARRFRLSSDPLVFGWRAMVVLCGITLLAALRSPEPAVFLGVATLFMALALVVRSAGLRITFWILSCLTMVRMVFFEELGLIQRLITENRVHTFWGLAGYEAIYIVFFTCVSLPFVFGFAAVYRASGVDFLWLKLFRERRGLLVVSGLAICVAVYLMFQPVYGPTWYNTIIVEQRYEMGADSSTIKLKASENMDGTLMYAGKWNSIFTQRTNNHDFTPTQPSRVHWVSLEQEIDSVKSVKDTMQLSRSLKLHSLLRPYTLSVTYRSSLPFSVESPWMHGGNLRIGRESDSLKIFTWYSFPDTNLIVPVTFGLRRGQKVAERVELTYDSLAHDLRLEREFTNIQYRTIVAGVDTFSTGPVETPERGGTP